jgi:hypothetical protein
VRLAEPRLDKLTASEGSAGLEEGHIDTYIPTTRQGAVKVKDKAATNGAICLMSGIPFVRTARETKTLELF